MNALTEKLKSFYTNIRAEFKKIIWPKKEELAKQTVIVIILCFIFGLLIFGMDTAFAALLKLAARVI